MVRRLSVVANAFVALGAAVLLVPPGVATATEPFPPPIVADRLAHIESPYAATGAWWGGQTHFHSAPHTPLSVAEGAEVYRGFGLSFVVVTDHGEVTGLPAVEGMTLIPGVEVSIERDGRGAHIAALGVTAPIPWADRSYQDVIDDVQAAGGLAVLAHPTYQGMRRTAPSWNITDLASLARYDGIEVYNHVTESWMAGAPWALDHLFAGFASGRPVWAYAVDDAHTGIDQMGHGFVVVQAPTREPADLLAALKAGRHVAAYTPTPGRLGVWVSEIRTEGPELTVATPPDRPATRIEVYDARGELRGIAPGPAVTYAAQGDEGFLVVVLRGADGSVVVLQPMQVHVSLPPLPATTLDGVPIVEDVLDPRPPTFDAADDSDVVRARPASVSPLSSMPALAIAVAALAALGVGCAVFGSRR